MTYDYSFVDQMRWWCKGKSWLVRMPIAAMIGYLLLTNGAHPLQYMERGWIDRADLIIHEVGHLLFIWAPGFVTILMGSVMQIAVPMIAMLMFLRAPDYAAAAFCLGWMGENLFDVSIYIADASERLLPLTTGNAADHDWGNILGMMGMTQYDNTIAMGVYGLGVIAMTVSLLWFGWLFVQMYRSQKDGEAIG